MSEPGGDQATQPGDQPRDRDRAGRPRNARPRDELGRPLSRAGSRSSSQTAYSAPPSSPASTISPSEAVGLGGGLLLAGRPFEAHEVFEDAWKSASGPDRDLWRGLAQVAVGLTHARRGNARGAVALLARGADRLRTYVARAGSASYGIDVEFVAARAEAIAAQIERDGLVSLPQAAFLLSLRATPSL
jgi:uncharacterized protein